MRQRVTAPEMSGPRSGKKKAHNGPAFAAISKRLVAVPVFIAKVTLATVVVIIVGRAMGVSI